MAANENETLREILLEQYRQCWEDKRNYDRMIWQTPAISLAIVAVIVAGIAGTQIPKSPTVILVAFAFALSITLVGTIQLAKHRFFSRASTAYLKRIQNLIRGNKSVLLRGKHRGIPLDILFTTHRLSESDTDVPTGWLYRRTAYDWLLGLMCVVMAGLILSIIIVMVRGCFC